MARYAVVYDSAMVPEKIFGLIEAETWEEADEIAFRTSGKPGYSAGSYTVYVDSFDKKALLEAAELLEDEQIEAIILEPGKKPYVKTILNELEDFQAIVGGYIETVPIGESAVLVVNEEGKLRRMKPNFVYNGDLIVGTAIMVGQSGDRFKSIGQSWKDMLQMGFLDPEVRTSED